MDHVACVPRLTFSDIRTFPIDRAKTYDKFEHWEDQNS